MLYNNTFQHFTSSGSFIKVPVFKVFKTEGTDSPFTLIFSKRLGLAVLRFWNIVQNRNRLSITKWNTPCNTSLYNPCSCKTFNRPTHHSNGSPPNGWIFTQPEHKLDTLKFCICWYNQIWNLSLNYAAVSKWKETDPMTSPTPLCSGGLLGGRSRCVRRGGDYSSFFRPFDWSSFGGLKWSLLCSFE